MFPQETPAAPGDSSASVSFVRAARRPARPCSAPESCPPHFRGHGPRISRWGVPVRKNPQNAFQLSKVSQAPLGQLSVCPEL